MLLTGPVFSFKYGQHERRYSTITLPFCEAVDILEIVPFDGTKIQGEQRNTTLAHARSIARCVEGGKFTPTAWAANLPRKLQLQIRWREDGNFELDLQKERLRHTDGGHRKESLIVLYEETEAALAKAEAKGKKEVAAELRLLLEDIQKIPVTLFVYLDGDPRVDFVNLQKGLNVDRSLLFNLELANAQFADSNYQLAADIARLLHNDKASPFYCLIRFDARKGPPVPMTSLCGRGASDLATSLIGLARLGAHYDLGALPLANYLSQSYQAIYAKQPELVINRTSYLATKAYDGKIGQTTMWVGVAIAACYAAAGTPLSETLLRELAEAAGSTLRGPINGNLSSSDKRRRIAEFVSALFLSRDEEVREGIPVGLINLLSPSAFGLKGRKK